MLEKCALEFGKTQRNEEMLYLVPIAQIRAESSWYKIPLCIVNS